MYRQARGEAAAAAAPGPAADSNTPYLARVPLPPHVTTTRGVPPPDEDGGAVTSAWTPDKTLLPLTRPALANTDKQLSELARMKERLVQSTLKKRATPQQPAQPVAAAAAPAAPEPVPFRLQEEQQQVQHQQPAPPPEQPPAAPAPRAPLPAGQPPPVALACSPIASSPMPHQEAASAASPSERDVSLGAPTPGSFSELSDASPMPTPSLFHPAAAVACGQATPQLLLLPSSDRSSAEGAGAAIVQYDNPYYGATPETPAGASAAGALPAHANGAYSSSPRTLELGLATPTPAAPQAVATPAPEQHKQQQGQGPQDGVIRDMLRAGSDSVACVAVPGGAGGKPAITVAGGEDPGPAAAAAATASVEQAAAPGPAQLAPANAGSPGPATGGAAASSPAGNRGRPKVVLPTIRSKLAAAAPVVAAAASSGSSVPEQEQPPAAPQPAAAEPLPPPAAVSCASVAATSGSSGAAAPVLVEPQPAAAPMVAAPPPTVPPPPPKPAEEAVTPPRRLQVPSPAGPAASPLPRRPQEYAGGGRRAARVGVKVSSWRLAEDTVGAPPWSIAAFRLQQ